MNLSLNGKWQFRNVSENKWYSAVVPGSVCNDLINNNLLEDPYYRDNEYNTLNILKNDFEYKRIFEIDKKFLESEKIELMCYGIDTIADIFINDIIIKKVSDMHRTFCIDIKQYLKYGENSILIYFHSAYMYSLCKHEQDPIHTSVDSIDGFTQIRKAHYMYGWDWGPKIPDMGIWRNIEIHSYTSIKLKDFYITQNHKFSEDLEQNKVIQVDLNIKLNIEKYIETQAYATISMISPKGSKFVIQKLIQSGENNIKLIINNPEIWTPNGYGEQNLYDVYINIKTQHTEINKEFQIGLRTIKLKTIENEYGKSFEFCVNGISIFAMGANYIPEENILSRCNRQRTEKLIKHCIKANYNCIRVWGGGYFCDDYFYELCDKYGIIVWQDLLFACGKYKLTDEFLENIIEETKDNMTRIRHHACMALWCGNNEIEWGWASWDNFKDMFAMKADYIKQFEYILPNIAKQIDPETSYWLSSPSSGGSFDDPNDMSRGDVHYWEVWHGLKPFTEYRKFLFRFCSEFGFQSFPCLKTIKTFTEPDDRNIFSYIMEQHQKNGSANGNILFYLSNNFKYPDNFENLLYISQLLQAEAIKYGVEHWRANRGICMGALYWQVNDCWPVASWSSIDYYGRWKALHYYAKKFYSPILLSAIDNQKKVVFNVSNETLLDQDVKIIWKIIKNTGKIINNEEINLLVPKLSAVNTKCLDFSNDIPSIKEEFETLLYYKLIINNKEISSNTLLFTKSKYFKFLNPNIIYKIEEKENSFIIEFETSNYAKYVEISLDNFDFISSDNYFDIVKSDVKIVEILKEDISNEVSLKILNNDLRIKSIYNV